MKINAYYGKIQVVVIFLSNFFKRKCSDKPCINPVTANLDAQYITANGEACKPPIDEIDTI